MEDNKTTKMLKIKLRTAELRLKTKFSTCLYLLSNDMALMLKDEVSALDLLRGSPLSASRAERSRKNPYFIWSDLQKLKESYDEFIELSGTVTPQGTDSYVDGAFERLERYQTLVEELIQILQENIQELCKSQGTHLPSSFPLDFKPTCLTKKEPPPEEGPDKSQSPEGPDESQPHEGLDKSQPTEGLDKSQPTEGLDKSKPLEGQDESQQPEGSDKFQTVERLDDSQVPEHKGPDESPLPEVPKTQTPITFHCCWAWPAAVCLLELCLKSVWHSPRHQLLLGRASSR